MRVGGGVVALNTFFAFHIFLYVSTLFQKEEVYLNLVLEFIPETVYRVARHYSKSKQTIPMSYVKVSQYKNVLI